MEHRPVDWLGEMFMKSRLPTGFHILLHAVATQCDSRQIALCCLLHDFYSVAVGQAKIADDEVESVQPEDIACLTDSEGGVDVMSHAAQETRHHFDRCIVIFDKQNSS